MRPSGRVAGDECRLDGHEGAVDEAEIHDFGRLGEMKIVALTPAAEAVGALKKFVADAGAPFGSDGGDFGDFLQMEILGIVAADDHGEGISKPSGSVTSRWKRSE